MCRASRVGALVLVGMLGWAFASAGARHGDVAGGGGKRSVPRVVSVQITVLESKPAVLQVTATGQVPTAGHTQVQLLRVVYSEPPDDGIQDYILFAVPPAGPAAQVLSRVEAVNEWKGFHEAAPWLKGVRIHGADGGAVAMLSGRE